jgi:CheY-like chemotaxis protein
LYILIRYGRVISNRYGPGIEDFVSSLGEITLRAGGFEASAKRRNEAAAALAAASVSRSTEGMTPATTADAAKQAVQAIGNLDSRKIRRIENSRVLWVDDNPGNNLYERQSLEALGVNSVTATSTDDAIDKIRYQKFDAIISDMSRPPDDTAGYTLLEKLRSLGDSTPFIIYGGSRQPRAESIRRGVLGHTNNPTELFSLVLSVLLH